MVVSVEITAFFDVAQCSQIDIDQNRRDISMDVSP
jgi:hypothetical protein